MIKVSVIVPVYNSEKYLDKCINSLLKQSLKEIELIFVNDGSNDNSSAIIKKYRETDKRIVLVEKQNGGQASARNLGLTYARGEYVAFVDSDDYVDKDMYKILYQKAVNGNFDILICNYYIEQDGNLIESRNKTINSEEIISNSQYMMSSPSPCDKLFKKQFLINSNFKFIEGIIYEDLATIPTLVLGNPRVLYVNKCLYHYVHTSKSTMRNVHYNKKYENIFVAIKYLYDTMINKGFNCELEYLLTFHFLYLASLNFLKYEKYELINQVANDMQRYFPRWYKNRLVLSNFTKKQFLYMKLFYYKKVFILKIYRRLFDKNDVQQKNN